MKKFLALFMTVLFLVSCITVIPTSAADTDTDEEVNIEWKLDLDAMENLSDSLGNENIRLETRESSNSIVEVDGEKCLSIHNVLAEEKNGRYAIHDTNNILIKPTTFYVDYDIYFNEFPSGTRLDGGEQRTPDEYPMSFFTWVVTPTNSPNYDRGIRIDSKGNLFYTRNTAHIIDAKLELKTWYHIRFAISPSTGGFEVYINNELVCNKKYAALSSLNGSYLRFLDTGLDYNVLLKNIQVHSNMELLGLNAEKSADYVGYQVTKTENDKFSIRFLSNLVSEGCDKAGYQVITLTTDKNGKTSESCRDYLSATKYDKILADGKTVSASALGSDYLTLCTVEELSADAGSMILAARPFVIKGDQRVYGKAQILYYYGDVVGGYPVFQKEASELTGGILATDDSHIRNKDGVYGKTETIEIKNNGSIENANTRRALVKFEISEDMVDPMLAMDKIYFQMYLKQTRTNLNDEETANGGVAANVFAIDDNWDEATATYANYTPQLGEKVGVLRMSGSGNQRVNIAEYIHEQLLDGKRVFSFLVENAINDGSAGQTIFYSKEAGDTYSPMLAFETAAFHHELNVTKKLANYGYDAWGYAENIVFNWVNELKDAVYAGGDPDAFELEKVDVTQPSGTHTVLTEGYGTGNPPSGNYQKQYARTIDTLISAGGYTEDKSLYPVYDEFGGITNSGIKGEATGWFHVETHGDRPYLIDPLGNPYFIVGVSSLDLGTENQKAVVLDTYGSEESYWAQITQELKDIGVNTANGSTASFTTTETPLMGFVGLSGIQSYMKNLGLVVTTGVAPEYKNNDTMNVFDPDFEEYVLTTNKATLKNYAENNRILGFTSDNEMTDSISLLTDYLTINPAFPENAFSYAVAWTFLSEKTGKINPSLQDVTPELQEEFKCLIFTTALGAVRKAIDTYAPGRMYIGNRTDANNKKSEGYLRAAGYNCDMLSINMYDGMQPSVANMATIYRYSGKPFFVTEFYAKAEESYDMNGQKLGNHQNAGWMVKTQQDRASYYENYTTLLLESKYCVGWVWFTFRDNDQSLFYPNIDDHSKILRIWQKGDNMDVVSYIDEDGVVHKATGNEYRFYTGIVNDMSSIGSNKGLFDNKTEVYQELADSFTRVSKNIIGLIRYFDNINK